MDTSTLPVGARIAQVVLAGTAVAYVATRAVNARADLMLVVEMVHGDLTDDVRTGLLPALDPQIVQLERTLVSAQRLAPSAIAVQAASLGHWWEPAPEKASELTASQQNRVDGYIGQLDAAAASYRTATRPWWRFSSQAPRHFHDNQRPRTLHATATPQRRSRRVARTSAFDQSQNSQNSSAKGWTGPNLTIPNLILPNQSFPNVSIPEVTVPRVTVPMPDDVVLDDAVPDDAVLDDVVLDDVVPGRRPRSPIPVPRAFERNLLFDGPIPAITVAISRSRGVDPAHTDHQIPVPPIPVPQNPVPPIPVPQNAVTPVPVPPVPVPPVSARHIELGHSGLSDVPHR